MTRSSRFVEEDVLPSRRQLEIPALGEAVRAAHLGLVADVAKGLVVLFSDHPAFPLEVSVNCVVEVEVVQDCRETPNSSRILHTSHGFILSK